MAEEQKSVETSPETQTEDPVVSLKNRFEKELTASQDEIKKLRKLATEAQQDAAEATRFLKKVLPDINRTIEKKQSFVEEFEASPESAVQNKLAETLAPISEDQRRIEHKLAIMQVKQKYADFDAYEPKIRELSFLNEKYAGWSWTEEGLEALYKIAKFEDMQNLLKSKKDEERVDREKQRAEVEGSSSDNGDQTRAKPKLDPAQKRMAKILGVPEDVYLKYKDFGVENG